MQALKTEIEELKAELKKAKESVSSFFYLSVGGPVELTSLSSKLIGDD